MVPNKKERKITRIDLFKMMLRSFYIQAVWNFERLQNLGFLFSVVPLIKRLYPRKEKRVEVINRHLEFFNTHPYMASFVVGVVTSLEEKMANSVGQINADDIRTTKAVMSGPLAAIGDTFFWATLRPFCALIGVAFILTLPRKSLLLGPLFFLLFFNIFALYIRFAGIWKGYVLGTGVVDILKKFDIQRLIYVVNILGSIVWVVLLFIYLADFSLGQRALFFGTLLVIYAGVRKKLPATILIYLILIWGLFLNCLGVSFKI